MSNKNAKTLNENYNSYLKYIENFQDFICGYDGNTMIQMVDYTYKDIKNIKINDYLYDNQQVLLVSVSKNNTNKLLSIIEFNVYKYQQEYNQLLKEGPISYSIE